MADPDLQMGGLPDPEIRGTRLGFQKNIFSALWGSVWSKNDWGGGVAGDGLPRPLPRIHHCLSLMEVIHQETKCTCDQASEVYGALIVGHKKVFWRSLRVHCQLEIGVFCN